jgi:hypothetical protein
MGETKMTNVTHHPCRAVSIWFDQNICQRTIECGHSKPGFWRDLKCTSEEIPNHIAMAYNYFEFVLGLIALWPSVHIHPEFPVVQE